MPVYAFTGLPVLLRNLLILWGFKPFQMEFSEDPEDMINNSFDYVKWQKGVKNGQTLIVITNALAKNKMIETLRSRTIE
jgi:pyruvate kinase